MRISGAAGLLWAVVLMLTLCLANAARAVAQNAPQSNREVADTKQSGIIPLEIYDFPPFGGMESSASNQVLQQAIPDYLFLRLLGQPRIQVRRVRGVYKSVQLQTTEKPSGPAARGAEAARRYALYGKVGFMEAPVSKGELASAPSFLLIKYRLVEVNQQPDSEPQIDADVTTTPRELTANLKQITDRVFQVLVPTRKIVLRLNPLQLDGFPADRKAFYAGNLPDLLKSELQSQGWISLAQTDEGADLSVLERATLKGNAYNLQVKISAEKAVALPDNFVEAGPTEEVLAGQLRLARKIIDALKIIRQLPPTTDGPRIQPSAEAYQEEAEKYQDKDPDVAIALYRRALELNSSNSRAKFSLGLAYLRKSQPSDALKILQGADVDSSAEGQYLRSLTFAQLGEPEQAMQAANECVRLAPDRGLAYWWRGRLYESKRDSSSALRDYGTALDLDPKESDFYEAKARVEQDVGQYDEAISVLQTAREQTSEGPRFEKSVNETRRQAAIHFLAVGKPEKALPYAVAASAAEPTSELGHRVLGTCYHQLHNLSEAERSLEEALNIEKTEEAYEELGRVQLDQGQRDRALESAEQAINIDGAATGPYAIFEQEITSSQEAGKVIKWLKAYSQKNPQPQLALIEWDYLQIMFMPDDDQELSNLQSAYAAATHSLPYRDWVDGWSNLVELDFMQGKYDEASSITRELLRLDLSVDLELNMGFYEWASRLLEGKCEDAENTFNAFAQDLEKLDVGVFSNRWIYKGTRRSLEKRASAESIDAQSWKVISSALGLLESPTLSRAAIKKFIESVSLSDVASCKSKLGSP